jgi:hypothetical protein
MIFHDTQIFPVGKGGVLWLILQKNKGLSLQHTMPEKTSVVILERLINSVIDRSIAIWRFANL